MTAQDIDLHELANMPGFGKAVNVLKEKGHWDESNVPGRKSFKFAVKARAYVNVETFVEVEGVDRADAMKLAKKKAADEGYWDIDDKIAEPDIIAVEFLGFEMEGAE